MTTLGCEWFEPGSRALQHPEENVAITCAGTAGAGAGAQATMHSVCTFRPVVHWTGHSGPQVHSDPRQPRARHGRPTGHRTPALHARAPRPRSLSSLGLRPCVSPFYPHPVLSPQLPLNTESEASDRLTAQTSDARSQKTLASHSGPTDIIVAGAEDGGSGRATARRTRVRPLDL